MTRPLAIGDRVRVIGPSIAGDDRHNGETFQIHAIFSTGNIPYNPYDGIYYPVSSLDQLDDLQIGDRVRIIGPDDTGITNKIGTEFEITEVMREDGVMKFSAPCKPWFPESSLKVVDEITVADTKKKLVADIEKAARAVRNILAPLADDRLTAIEARLHDVEQHIKSLEEFARDQEGRNRRHEHPCCAANPKPDVVEPKLKVGDWAVVIEGAHKGKFFKITYIKPDGFYGSEDSWNRYFSGYSLRRLTDEEIARRLNA